ncbi:MAG: branched-chain amino acid ABC transporter permease [Deltaproteobacteria bacterium]|nr:branched-chain amino acid ABC transporter permease [Deltaproteobacteria bacterium]
MDLKRDYYEDVRLFPRMAEKFWFAVLLGILAAYMFLAPPYYLYLANLIFIHTIVAVGLNLLVGYTGQISLGHAGFFAIGAYGTTLLVSKAGAPYPIALLAAGAAAALFGFLLGLPALRLKGPYLAIATLGFGLTITQVIGRWELFGGHMGMQVPKPSVLGLSFSSDRSLYALAGAAAVFACLLAANLVKSRVGRAFMAIRDNDTAAAAMGVDIPAYKTLAFALSALYAGVAGGLMAPVLGFINPGMFNLFLSITFLAMVVVGGPGSIAGSVFGAVLITVLNLKLSTIQELPVLGALFTAVSERWFSVSGLANVATIAFGFIMVAIILVEPLGLYGLWIRTKLYFKTWPF